MDEYITLPYKCITLQKRKYLLIKHKAMRKLSLLFLLLISTVANAQEAAPEMADKFRADGKIYVVVLVLATIFAGILAYLVRLDRKISRLENEK
jgi:CcmD family protein